jgi:hypothetical protein
MSGCRKGAVALDSYGLDSPTLDHLQDMHDSGKVAEALIALLSLAARKLNNTPDRLFLLCTGRWFYFPMQATLIAPGTPPRCPQDWLP